MKMWWASMALHGHPQSAFHVKLTAEHPSCAVWQMGALSVSMNLVLSLVTCHQPGSYWILLSSFGWTARSRWIDIVQTHPAAKVLHHSRPATAWSERTTTVPVTKNGRKPSGLGDISSTFIRVESTEVLQDTIAFLCLSSSTCSTLHVIVYQVLNLCKLWMATSWHFMTIRPPAPNVGLHSLSQPGMMLRHEALLPIKRNNRNIQEAWFSLGIYIYLEPFKGCLILGAWGCKET